MGNGETIKATTDPWLRSKAEFCVKQNGFYEGRSEIVSSLFIPGEKRWNESLIKEHFLEVDANAILAILIPQREVVDRIAWTGSNKGIYSAKIGYHFWYNLNHEATVASQSVGWKKVWNLPLPPKVKVFIWCFLS